MPSSKEQAIKKTLSSSLGKSVPSTSANWFVDAMEIDNIYINTNYNQANNITQRPKTTQAMTHKSQMYNANVKGNANYDKNHVNANRCSFAKTEIDSDELLYLEPLHSEEIMNYKPSAKYELNSYLAKRAMASMFGNIDTNNTNTNTNDKNNTRVKQTAVLNARELVNALYVNINDIVNAELRRVVSSVVIAVDPLNCNAGTPFPSAAKTIEVDMQSNYEPVNQNNNFWSNYSGNSSRTTRLVYFASRQPPEPVQAEEQERYISAFVKIHCTETNVNNNDDVEHVGNQLNEIQNSNNNVETNVANTQNNNEDEESDFYVAFGTVLGYSDSGDAIIWHKRGELFASRLYISDILELHRADAIRCHHCDQVFLSEELEPHIQTHLKSEWAVAFVEDVELGTACGDTSLLQRCKPRCRLGEGAQGVVWLCEVINNAYSQNFNNNFNENVTIENKKQDNTAKALAPIDNNTATTIKDETAAMLEKAERNSQEKEAKGKENDLAKWLSKKFKLDDNKKEKKKIQEKNKVKINQSSSHVNSMTTLRTKANTVTGDLFHEINVNTSSNATKENATSSSTTLQSDQAKKEDLPKEDDQHEYVVIKIMHIKDVNTCHALYHQLVRYMTSLACDHLVEYLAVQMMPNKHTLRIFMPYYSEGNFVELIRRESTKEHMAESRIQSWMLQLAKGLQFLHDRNPPIVHGDVKADNVMLFNHNDQVVLMDMETSKELRLHHSTIHSADGTNEYMAPETVRYARLMPASDMWSLGVLFYVLTVMPEFPMITHPITKESTLLNSNCWMTDEELHHLEEYSDMKTYCRRSSLNAMSTHSVAKRLQYSSCQWNKNNNKSNNNSNVENDDTNKPTPDHESTPLTTTASSTNPTTCFVSLPECVAFEMAKYGYSKNFIQLIMDLLNFDPLARPSASEVIDRLIVMMTQNLIH